ncbi:MAG: restriction endonuclease subunit S [Nitrososphaerota archaeon]|jgi:type I restriction enzyme S subunit|nr:restriction endonuclease subunit S [Nitrososphaerota archaeon]
MIVKLGDVASERCEIFKGCKQGLPIVGLEHIVPEELLLFDWDVNIDNTFTKMFRKGQILFGRRRAYLKKAAVAPFDGICSGDITVIEAQSDKLLPDLLPFIIQNDSFFDFAVEKSAGSLSPRVKWTHLSKFEFNLPSLPEQRKLASLLLAAISTREAYKKLLTLTDELIKSQFIELFGDPMTNEKAFPLTALKNCCIINPRKSGDERLSDELAVSFVPMASVSEKGVVDLSEIRQYSDVRSGFTYFSDNDVLFAKITPCMENGKGAIMQGLTNGIGFGSTEFHVLRPIEGISDPCWIYQILAFEKFRKDAAAHMTGSAGQRRVPVSYLENYVIGLPPIKLQKRFADFVRITDKSKFALQRAIDELDAAYKVILREKLG